MSSLIIKEHSSPSYAPRTYYNARVSDLTIAIAVDFTTAGEKLTKKAAGGKYLHIAWGTSITDAAADILEVAFLTNPKIINIAGNGIYTLSMHGIDQHTVNIYLYEILKIVHSYSPIEKIVSGGQTGVDIAGIVAACALDISAEATLPKGFVQRVKNKVDKNHSLEDITRSVLKYIENLLFYKKVSDI